MNTHRTTVHHSLPRLARLLPGPALVALGVAIAGPVAASAQAPAISCGTVVTGDVRLTADLNDCVGSGLVIGASGVTIDLDGHTIDGTGSGAGIDNEGGHDDVRVTDGTIRGFVFGVELFEVSGARLDRLFADSNLNGLNISRSDAIEIDRVTVTNNVGPGIEVTFSDRIVVRRSTATGNGGGGIVDRYNTDNRYERNTLSDNGGAGLTLYRTGFAVAERNDVVGNGHHGIEVTGVEDALLVRNSVVANVSDGISIDRSGNTLIRNEANANGGVGINAPDGTIDGGRNRATGNIGGDCTGVACR